LFVIVSHQCMAYGRFRWQRSRLTFPQTFYPLS
jgi:hypothetical protein